MQEMWYYALQKKESEEKQRTAVKVCYEDHTGNWCELVASASTPYFGVRGHHITLRIGVNITPYNCTQSIYRSMVYWPNLIPIVDTIPFMYMQFSLTCTVVAALENN